MIRDNRANRQRASVCAALAVALPLALLAACNDDGSSPIADADASADQILESSRPGAQVGLTLTVPGFAAGTATFSLIDNSAGAFKIDPTTGIVSLAAAIDYEQANERIIVAAAVLQNAGHRLRFERRFRIAVLDSPPPAIEIAFPFAHARYSDPVISVSGRVRHPQLENVKISARAGAGTVDAEIADADSASKIYRLLAPASSLLL